MSIKSFLNLVEIQTKIASMFPFIIGNLFAYYYYGEFSVKNMLVMFVSLISIDMATTAINNYMDFKKGAQIAGAKQEKKDAILFFGGSEKIVLMSIFILIVIGVVFGIYLVLLTDLVILLIGVASFGVGILYSFGPLPLYRTPFGELFSGFFMGFFILFLSVYIHIVNLGFIVMVINVDIFSIAIKWQEILKISLLSIPLIFGISNIMLANNICDMKDDLANNRYTLPIYIGKSRAMFVLKWSYWSVAVVFVLLVVLKLLPLYGILALLIFVPISKLIETFEREQVKEKTFVIAVKSFVLIGSSITVTLILACILK